MERCWILVGMMGAGKSSVGRALADLAGREFQDTDQILQHKLGRPIPQIFQLYGEAAFRDHESSVLRSLVPGLCVLATGGGIVCRPENWTEMRRLGRIIYLRASRETLIERLEASKKKRPLLAEDDWESRVDELLNARAAFYDQSDHFVQVDNRSIEEVAKLVLAEIQKP